VPRFTLSILTDNRSADPELGFEHGWSVLVDLGAQGRWLWDTGQTGLFLENARALGLDPTRCDGLALSHGHHDHAGGLPALLEAGFTGPIVGHPELLSRRYSRRDGLTYRSIGMGDGRISLPLPGYSPETDIRELAPGLTFVTGIVRRPGAFAATTDLFRDTAGQETDTVPDDACLVLDGEKGTVVLLGCCHSGLGNTLAHLRARLGITEIEAVIGGLHLGKAPDWALDETLASLAEYGVARLSPGHCTGEAGFDRLQQDFPGRTTITGAGMRLTF